MSIKNEAAIQELLQSCKYMIDQSIKDAPFDRTVPGVVVSSGINNNYYIVSVYGKNYTLPSNINNALSANTVVKITIPEGNMNYAYISSIFGGEEKGESGGQTFEIGNGLKLINNTLSVDTTTEVEEDNTQPVTSGAVYMQLGNVEALLANI